MYNHEFVLIRVFLVNMIFLILAMRFRDLPHEVLPSWLRVLITCVIHHIQNTTQWITRFRFLVEEKDHLCSGVVRVA